MTYTNTDGELVPVWFNDQEFPDELMKPTKWKALITQNPVCNKETPPPPPQASLPQRFSAPARKYALQNDIESDDDCFAGNRGDESDTDTSDNNGDSGDSDDKVYTWLP